MGSSQKMLLFLGFQLCKTLAKSESNAAGLKCIQTLFEFSHLKALDCSEPIK